MHNKAIVLKIFILNRSLLEFFNRLCFTKIFFVKKNLKLFKVFKYLQINNLVIVL